MYIPRIWVKSSADGQTPDGRQIPVSVWGWGDDDGSAKREATNRLQRLLDRIRRGESVPHRYAYGSRPLREEILQIFAAEASDEPAAILTRNSYGAQVLNTARLLFLDIDLEPTPFLQRLLQMFGLRRDSSEEQVLAKLRAALQRYGWGTFRVYRTASGLRVMGIDREFDPTAAETHELMKATGTDPAFLRLCLAQRSFRARLTPKPWRCRRSLPPNQYPRPDGEPQRRFASWLTEYEKASDGYATCRYLETVGGGGPKGVAGKLIDLHDRVTRSGEPLPLA